MVNRGDQVLEFVRDGDKLVLKSPAEHPKLDDYQVEDVGRALETLTLTDVKPAAQEPGEKLGTAVITTTDGDEDNRHRVQGRQRYLGAVRSHWRRRRQGRPPRPCRRGSPAGPTRSGAWKEKAFVPTLDELKADEPPPKPPAAPAPEAPAPDAPKQP